MINKKYEIHQSPLYKLNTKKRLAKILKIKESKFHELGDDKNFRTFDKEERSFQEPIGELKRTHKSIQKLFSRILVPEYLFSGVKGKSTRLNAEFHSDSKFLVTIDIEKFYRNTTFQHIKNMFKTQFFCAPDIASIISNLICYDRTLPTGSHVSQSIAFWAHKQIFDSICIFAKNNGIRFSLYVDDMTFSSYEKLPECFIGKIKGFLATNELKIKNKKTKRFGPTDFKLVTGVIISPLGEILLKNKIKKKTVELIKSDPDKKKIESLRGIIAYGQSIEAGVFGKTRQKISKKTGSIKHLG